MEHRCIWSRRRSATLVELTIQVPCRFGIGRREQRVHVLPEHRADVVRHAARIVRFARWYVVACLAAAAALTVAASTGRIAIAGVVLGATGALTWAVPIATPETVRLLGMAASIAAVRVTAVVTMALGVWLALVSLAS